MQEFLGFIATVVGFGWAILGVAAPIMRGYPAGMWRLSIWLGPFAFLVFPPRE
jgi:hypothetical protein